MQQIEQLVTKLIRQSKTPRILAISPHLDDAVLSIGATLASLTSKNSSATVFTVFAGIPDPPYSPAACHIHDTWGLRDQPVHARRAEDIAAVRYLNAIPKHGDFLDLIYRVPAENVEDIFEYSAREYDSQLVTTVAGIIIRLIEAQKPDVVLTCAAVGGHTDHRHARDATITACTTTRLPLFLWEDIPYAIHFHDIASLPANVKLSDRALGSLNDAKAFNIKYDAIECYTSQQAELWRDNDFRSLLDEHAESRPNLRVRGGRAELLWRIDQKQSTRIQ